LERRISWNLGTQNFFMIRATFRFFADETAEDAAANKSDEEIWWRNSLFLK
jgi:hypothetical protein